jgi:hypothetical protein
MEHALMAAPVRIESYAWDDPRYAVLAKLAGLVDRDTALIKCARLWSLCTDLNTRVLSKMLIDAHMGIDGFADFLVQSDLAEETPKGFRIRGAKGRTEWLGKRKKAGQLGGVASGSKRQATAKQTIRDRQANAQQAQTKVQPSALPLSLPPAQEEERELTVFERAKLDLIGGYARRFESRTNLAWQNAGKSDSKIQGAARWCIGRADELGLEPGQVVYALLEEFFADPRAALKSFPWGFLSENPDEYLLKNREIQSILATREAAQ